MLVAESVRGRRLACRLARGADLTAALMEICRARGVRSAELRGIGALESVELAELDQARKAWKPSRSLTGGVELLSLAGNVSERDGKIDVHLHATVMRERDNGIEVLGGHVVSARVFNVEMVIDVFDDLLLRRAHDDSIGAAAWSDAISIPTSPDSATVAAAASPPPVAAPRPTPTPAPTSTAAPAKPAPTWADVAAASETRPREAESELEPIVAIGDFIDHPTFGRCEVQRIEADEFAHVRLKSGRLVRLSLEALRLSIVGREGKRRIFRALP